MKNNKRSKAARQALENLENRQLLSSVLLDGTSLELHGNSDHSNKFVVRSAGDDRVLAFANGKGKAASLDSVNEVVIYLGNDKNIVSVASDVTTPVEVIRPDGKTTIINPGTTKKFNPSHSGSGSSSGSGDTGTGGDSGSSGGGSSTSGVGSSSTGAGTSSTGSGSSSTGSGSSSTGSGTSSTGSGTSSTGSGTSSTGSGTSSTGSGSSSTGSGTSSTGSGSSSTGSGTSSTGSGSGSTGTASNPNDPATPHPVITVTSVSTILPLETVNVQAIKSTFGSGTNLNSTISWNFGDSGSTYNSNLIGFNAAHAYANAGTYTITCTITTPDGHVGITNTTVTVAADTRKTIYVSANGSDSNNGSSASQAIQSIARLNQLITSNTRVLFQDGGTYSMKSSIDLSGLQHVYLGTYGSGAAPILMATGGNVGSLISLSTSSEGIVVQGLTFDSTSTSDDGTAPDGCDIAGNGIVFLDNTFYHLEDDFNLNQNPTNVLIQGNSSPNANDLYGYFAWTQGTEINIIGNTVANSIDQALVRADAVGTQDVNLSFNNLTKTSPAGQTYKNCWTCMWVDYSTTYMNTFTNGAMQTGPLDPSVDGQTPDTATCSNVLVSSNVFNNSKMIVSPNTQGLQFVNNVLHSPDTNAIWIAGSGDYDDVNWVSNDLYFGHNTLETTDGDGSGFIVLYGGGTVTGISVVDNVYDAPNIGYGDYDNAFIYTGSMSISAFTSVTGNVLYNGSNASSSANYVNGNWMSQSDFDSDYGLGTNKVQAVDFGSTWEIDGAGSDLPVAGN